MLPMELVKPTASAILATYDWDGTNGLGALLSHFCWNVLFVEVSLNALACRCFERLGKSIGVNANRARDLLRRKAPIAVVIDVFQNSVQQVLRESTNVVSGPRAFPVVPHKMFGQGIDQYLI